MNLFNKIFSTGLLILLASFILSSCHDNVPLTNPIGGIGDTTVYVKYKEIPLTFKNKGIEVNEIPLDSINTTSSLRWLVGIFEDNNVGKLENESYAMIARNLKNDTLQGVNTSAKKREFVSLELRLKKNNYALVENENTEQGIEIFQLDKVLKDTTYYASEAQTASTLLGDTTFSGLNGDLLSFVLDEDAGVALGKAFFDKLNGSTNPRFDTLQSELNKFFKGIAIKPSANSTGIYDFSRLESSLVLNYKYYATDTSKTSYSGIKLYSFQNYSNDTTYTTSYNHFKKSRTKYTDSDTSKFIMQNGYGVYPVINLSMIRDSLANIPNIVLNSLELSVPTDKLSGKDLFPPSTIFFPFVGQDNKILSEKISTNDTTSQTFNYYLTPDRVRPMAQSGLLKNLQINDAKLSINYDVNYKQYNNSVTFFSQDLIGTYNNTTRERDRLELELDGKLVTLDRMLLVADDFNSLTKNAGTLNYLKLAQGESIKLKVYYSEKK